MAHSELSILIIDENRIRASIIEEGLREAGHSRVVAIHDVNEVGRTIEAAMPDVIVIDLENPKRDTLEHFFVLSRAIQRPIAMFVDRSDGAMIEKAVEAGVSAYVVDGLKKERVKPILDMTVSRFHAFNRLRAELDEVKSALKDRKIVEKAKGILMKSRGIDEDKAYELLRKTAMSQGKRIADVAQALVSSVDLLKE